MGPAGIILGLPLVCYILAYLVASLEIKALSLLWEETPLLSLFGCLVVYGYVLLVLLLHVLLPAKKVQGTQLANNTRLIYRLNGLRVFLLILATVFVLSVAGILNLSVVHDHWMSCLTASFALSSGLSFYLFLSSFHKKAVLAKGGQTGYRLWDFSVQSIALGSLDLKEFCELYPGLIGWILLNLSNWQKQYQSLGYVTNSMMLVNAFQFIYVLDGLYCEPSILTTMDITNDGFGFMLAFGDLTWVPFIYALQSKYLVHHPTDLSFGYAAVVVCLKLLGYWVFRGANSQKDQFRRDPLDRSVSHLKTLKTARGRRLIVSSWWGLARHINYTGDWLMGLSWCLTCGFGSPIPYFYAVYFGVLLVHRDLRDQESCREKYGADWDKYCALVPYRFIPYVY